MRITVVFEDDKANVDGDVRFGLGITPADPNWRVIQWYDDGHGIVEVYQGDRIWLTDFSVVQPYYDAWVAAAPPVVEPVVEEIIVP